MFSYLSGNTSVTGYHVLAEDVSGYACFVTIGGADYGSDIYLYFVYQVTVCKHPVYVYCIRYGIAQMQYCTHVSKPSRVIDPSPAAGATY